MSLSLLKDMLNYLKNSIRHNFEPTFLSLLAKLADFGLMWLSLFVSFVFEPKTRDAVH